MLKLRKCPNLLYFRNLSSSEAARLNLLVLWKEAVVYLCYSVVVVNGRFPFTHT